MHAAKTMQETVITGPAYIQTGGLYFGKEANGMFL